ncbi:MAG: DUF4340 domain-containing protein [Eubacteriales bacterium]
MKKIWKSYKVPILLAAACLLLLILIWAVLTLRSDSDSPDGGSNADIRILVGRYPADEVSYLRIKTEGKSYSFHKKQSVWTYVQDSSLPVRESAVGAVLSTYETLTAIRVLENPDDLSEYGLDDPERSMILVCDGEQIEFRFGAYSSYGGGYYLEIAGDPHVYLVDSDFYSALDFSIEDFFTCPTLPDRSEIRQATFTYPSGESVTLDAEGHPDLFACLISLTPTRILELGSDHDSSYGLDKPILCQTVCQEEDILLAFGPGESDEYIYLRIGESKAVFLFEAEHTDALLSLLKQDQGE